MNIIIYALIILVVSYILLRVIASASSKKISVRYYVLDFEIVKLHNLKFATASFSAAWERTP